MPVNFIIHFKAQAAKQAAFQAVIETVKTGLPKVPGCLAVSVMQSVEDPCRFTLVETWEDRSRHQAHIETLTADGTWTSIESHLEDQPVSDYFRRL
jgi:quinol monooxygenase YgiN